MRFYLIGALARREELRRYSDELTERGHQVTASWLYAPPAFEDDGTSRGSEEIEEATARRDWQDLASAEAVLVFTEPPDSPHTRGNRHAEFGIALGSFKPIFMIGPCELMFHRLRYARFEDWQSFVTCFWDEEVSQCISSAS